MDRNAAGADHLPPERAYDPGRDRVIEPEWISDRNRLLTDLQRILGVRKLDRSERAGRHIDLDDRDILARLDTDNFGWVRPLIVERDGECACALNHVKIRDDRSRIVPRETRPRASGHFGRSPLKLIDEHS